VTQRGRPVTRWLHGTAWASQYGARVRVQLEGKNFRGEVYVDRKNARELRDSLDQILAGEGT
jgi:hypothetical protein